MTALDLDTMTCECGATFTPKRATQRHCSKRCRHRSAQRHLRGLVIASPGHGHPQARVIASTASPDPDGGGLKLYQSPERVGRPEHGSNPDGSTPGALQGDDVELEYYADGYPKLPACLNRRRAR